MLAPLNEVLRSHPHNIVALGLRAQLCGKMGDWDQVIADCTALLKQEPDYLKYLALRAQAYYEKADVEHALADANDFLRRMEPHDAEDYRLRGELHRLRAGRRRNGCSACSTTTRPP